MEKKVERLGMKNIAKNGQEMEIIEYLGSKQLTIRFEDGTIVKNKSYKNFCRGEILNPNKIAKYNRDEANKRIKNKYSNKYLGKEYININGLKAKIIDYKSFLEVYVQFEDGSVKRTTINYLKIGKFFSPNELCKSDIDNINAKNKYIGMEVLMKNGQKAKVIDYLNNDNITIEFEDGYVTTTRLSMFKSRTVKNPNLDKSKTLIGESKVMNCGKKATILEYLYGGVIIVEFENGVKKKSRYNQFKKGLISCDNIKNNSEKKEERLNQIYHSKFGVDFKIKEYITSTDITIEYEDGEINKCTWSAIQRGRFGHPHLDWQSETEYHGFRCKKAFNLGNEVYYKCVWIKSGESMLLTPKEMREYEENR